MSRYKSEINNYLKDYKNEINFQQLDRIDKEINNNKIQIGEIEEYIKIEHKLESLRKLYKTADDTYSEKKLNKESLGKEAQKDIFQKIKDFSDKFKELMTNSLEDCKTASIDIDNYMPIIDNGAYREKSASVHLRMMYFYTLLHMSLKYKEIKFPNFLIIDTPDTDGIDPDSLKRAIRQLENITNENEDYQIILTTFEYPGEYEYCTRGDILIKKRNYLLKKRETIFV